MGISYQKKRQTPKRGAGGSNPLWDARKHRCKLFSGFAAFFVPPSPDDSEAAPQLKYFPCPSRTGAAKAPQKLAPPELRCQSV